MLLESLGTSEERGEVGQGAEGPEGSLGRRARCQGGSNGGGAAVQA